MTRTAYQPASGIAVLRPAVALVLLGRSPPLPSGCGGAATPSAHREVLERAPVVLAAAAPRLMPPGKHGHSLLAALPAGLAASYPLLCFLAGLLRGAVVPWVRHQLSIGSHEQHLPPHLTA